jgi:hypothetical protein
VAAAVPPELAGLASLLRLTATAGWRALNWGTSTALQTGNEALNRALDGDPPVVILADLAAELRCAAMTALSGRDAAAGPPRRDGGAAAAAATPDELRALGAALLHQSAGVTGAADDAGHPAYARMLSEITPDEARILRLLYEAGPQPAIDVRTNRPLGIGSELVAGGLNMIAEYAGLRHMDRIHPYLTNLNRQGLVAFSKEKVDDPDRYQLIEAQPRVSEARARVGHLPKTVYRSIALTTFGRDFCAACLPVNGADDGDSRPGDSRPGDSRPGDSGGPDNGGPDNGGPDNGGPDSGGYG